MTSPTSSDAPETVPTQSSLAGRWTRVALAVSLAINLGVAGIAAGAMFHNGGPMQSRTLIREVGFGSFTEALSQVDRASLRRAFFAASPELRDGPLSQHADAAKVLAQLRASPFDAAALQIAFDQQSGRIADRLKLGQGLIFDLIVGMSNDARLAFADRLEVSLAKRAKRRDAP